MRIPSISAAILLAALAGCSLPGEGPTTSAILDGNAPAADTLPYSMIELNAATMQRLDAMGGDKTAEPRLPPPGAIGRIGAGDVLDVSIWETQTNDRAGSGGSDRAARVHRLGGVVVRQQQLIATALQYIADQLDSGEQQSNGSVRRASA